MVHKHVGSEKEPVPAELKDASGSPDPNCKEKPELACTVGCLSPGSTVGAASTEDALPPILQTLGATSKHAV